MSYNGEFDAFVAKVNPSGTELIYAGYIGGAKGEIGYGIAVDGTGSVYVSGWTNSDETTFPVRGGPDLTHNGGNEDAFIAKVYRLAPTWCTPATSAVRAKMLATTSQ